MIAVALALFCTLRARRAHALAAIATPKRGNHGAQCPGPTREFKRIAALNGSCHWRVLSQGSVNSLTHTIKSACGELLKRATPAYLVNSRPFAPWSRGQAEVGSAATSRASDCSVSSVGHAHCRASNSAATACISTISPVRIISRASSHVKTLASAISSVSCT